MSTSKENAGLRAATGVALLVWAGAAAAFPGRCLLEVEGTRYLNGRCNVELQNDGSFSVGTGEETRSEYFAYVSLEPEAGVATGYWNGPNAEGHAHYELGTLKRDGACWENARARVCAWRIDEPAE